MNPIPSHLAEFLDGLKPFNAVWIGYSGGVDSSVLLHAVSRLERAFPLKAVHVNHGLHPDADDWVTHCQTRCETLNVPLTVRRVEAAGRRGESPEAAARAARYEAFRALLGDGDVLLTAQHRDDQGETVLLQLLRGAGPAGLAAMPEVGALGAGRLARPFLDTGRNVILDYARESDLNWIEDSTNRDTDYSRNYLRHRIWPRLREHWPGLGRTLARAARLQAAAAAVLDECAAEDFERLGGTDGPLPADDLAVLSPARRANVVRHWLGRQGVSVPGEAVLQQILGAVVARADASPCVAWEGLEVRRHRHRLYLIEPGGTGHLERRYQLEPGGRVDIPELGITLDTDRLRGTGLAAEYLAEPLEIGFRRGGERIRLPGRDHRHSLKKLLQDRDVPPWLRDRLPLIYSGRELVAVLGLDPPLIAGGQREVDNG